MYPYEKPRELDTLARGEERMRKTAIAAAWTYYNGAMKKPLKVRAGRPDDNIILMLVRKAIDQGVSLLFGDLPELELQQGEQTMQEDRLSELWTANREAILLHNVALYGALAGHCFLKMVYKEEQDLKLVNLTPELITVFWHPDDKEQVACYKIAWTAGDTEYRQDLVARWALGDDTGLSPRLGDGEWLIRELRRTGFATTWEVVSEVVWGWDFPPILDWQNLPNPGGYYGRSDLVNPGLNDQANFVASNMNRILKYHAHPRTLVFGIQADQIQDTSVDNMWAILDKDARVENLEMQSDLSSSLALLNEIKGAFYSEHRAVDMSTLRDRIGQITNFGLRTLFKDALDKLRTKRELYGAALVEISRRMVALDSGADVKPDIHWGDPLPFNGVEEIQEITQEMALGILSKETAASIRGRDWATEQERLENEKASEESVGSMLLRAFEGGQA